MIYLKILTLLGRLILIGGLLPLSQVVEASAGSVHERSDDSQIPTQNHVILNLARDFFGGGAGKRPAAESLLLMQAKSNEGE